MNLHEAIDALIAGDLDAAASVVEGCARAAQDPAERVAAQVALARLRGLSDGLEAADSVLTEAEQGDLDDRSRGLLALERASLAALRQDPEACQAALAAGPDDWSDLPTEPLHQAALRTSALAALTQGAGPDPKALMAALSPAHAAGVQATMLMAEGRLPEALELLGPPDARPGHEPGPEAERLIQQGTIHLLSQDFPAAITALGPARRCAVEAVDPTLYVGAAMLLATAHALADQHVEAFAVCMRAEVSLEDLIGEGAGRLFREYLESFRAGWGEAYFAEVARSYVRRRQAGDLN